MQPAFSIALATFIMMFFFVDAAHCLGQSELPLTVAKETSWVWLGHDAEVLSNLPAQHSVSCGSVLLCALP